MSSHPAPRRDQPLQPDIVDNASVKVIGLGGVGLSDCIRNAAALARTIGPA